MDPDQGTQKPLLQEIDLRTPKQLNYLNLTEVPRNEDEALNRDDNNPAPGTNDQDSISYQGESELDASNALRNFQITSKIIIFCQKIIREVFLYSMKYRFKLLKMN